jgi:hypothetical protein
MASSPIGPDCARVTAYAGSVPNVVNILARLDRATVETFVAVAIDLLDAMDPDEDAEELPLDDAFIDHDPAFAYMDGDGRDSAWTEWHTRGRHKLSRGRAEMPDGMILEDDEDDDVDTSVEDSPEGFDPEMDTCAAGDDGCGPVFSHGFTCWGSYHDVDSDPLLPCPDYGIDQTKPGALPDFASEQALMKPHLLRARRRLKLRGV